MICKYIFPFIGACGYGLFLGKATVGALRPGMGMVVAENRLYRMAGLVLYPVETVISLVRTRYNIQ